eukprot:c1067_g1_i1.p1 GENE.c1067_g1_i1~~c1067_g1_i1.p1  ORF type:complete len:185 (+),score=19.30 c1067_g1_i1:37-591(+)
MGQGLGKVFGRLFGPKRARLLMVGLDGAGKTTILNKLKLGVSNEKQPSTVPTLGFNVQTVKFHNIKLQVWDVGGQDSIRPLWRHYFTGSQALIYVVDSHDRVRLDKAKQEFDRIINDRAMTDVPVLVFANKSDLADSMPAGELSEALELHKLTGKTHHIQQCCALTGLGLEEGLKWLSSNLKQI